MEPRTSLSLLERAIAIAVEAHAGQRDKAGAPYILHPLRVMLRLDTEEERIAGVLHDVVEDTDWTLERLREEGFSDSILAALDATTRRAGEAYDDFIRRAGADPLGRRVKRADLADNMDLGRLAEPSAEDLDRIRKYRRAAERLDRPGGGPCQGDAAGGRDEVAGG